MKNTFLLFIILITARLFSQSTSNSFFTPSDSLNKKRTKTVFIAQSSLAALTLAGLNQLWYADYPKSKFHTINDNNEWQKMDKLGHFYSCYHLGSQGANSLKWAGANKKSQLLYGATIGLVFMSTVEVFDGFSSQWGFSWGDMLANTSGTALYISQDLVWKEQRIIPKFSFHTTQYALARPSVLGSSIQEQILKDYNGQTYWLSANLKSFVKKSKIPSWANIAIGYGANGMIAAKKNDAMFYQQQSKQFYISFDADLTKIKTKSHVLKTIFYVFNTLKIPAPTLEISSKNNIKFYYLYF